MHTNLSPTQQVTLQDIVDGKFKAVTPACERVVARVQQLVQEGGLASEQIAHLTEQLKIKRAVIAELVFLLSTPEVSSATSQIDVSEEIRG